MKTYGARPYGFKSAPKPANFDELSAAAAAAKRAAEQADPHAVEQAKDQFAAEHGRYRDQTSRSGVHPGTLLGVLDDEGNVT